MFGSMFRDFEEDPFFRDFQDRHRQQMSSMFSADPFLTRRDPLLAIDDGSSTSRRRPREPEPRQEHRARSNDPFALSPFGMMDGGFNSMFGNMQAMMGNMRQSFERMANDPNSHSYSSTSVMSYSSTGNGAPKVYQASSSTRQVPGGVKETRRTVRDSEKGLEKMAIGHHMGDRAHVIEKSRDARTGQVEENQEFLNLDEGEASSFNREFTRRTRGAYPDQASLSGPMRHTRREYPALPDTRREHRENRTGTSRYQRDRTPPRLSGPSKGGRKYDKYDTKDTKYGTSKYRHEKHDKYDKPPKPDRGVHF